VVEYERFPTNILIVSPEFLQKLVWKELALAIREKVEQKTLADISEQRRRAPEALTLWQPRPPPPRTTFMVSADLSFVEIFVTNRNCVGQAQTTADKSLVNTRFLPRIARLA